ncbi:MAG: Subtilisin-like protein serine protease, partial [candidate division WS6 bacterium GW2011_GWA2_37_6]
MSKKISNLLIVFIIFITTTGIVNPVLAIDKNSDPSGLKIIKPTSEDNLKLARIQVEEELKEPHKNNFFFVKYKKGVSAEKKKSITSKNEAEDLSKAFNNPLLEKKDISIIKAGDESKLKDLMTKFKVDDNVEWVQSNNIFKKSAWTRDDNTKRATPNDYDPVKHWYYDKKKLPEAYYDQGCGLIDDSACGGSNNVVVAVLDSGLAFENRERYFYHPTATYYTYFYKAPEINGIDLWINEGESYDHNDNDNNGFCDDVHGINIEHWITGHDWDSDDAWRCTNNFIESGDEGKMDDEEGHGTFVTGIISSLIDNGADTSFGIAPKVQIMPVRILDHWGETDLISVYMGIYYAVHEGADIINLSIEGNDSEGILIDVIQYAKDNNVLIVASSGNGNTNINYPAVYSRYFDNVISVGASTESNSRASYSNYGTDLNMVAPVGENGVWHQTYQDTEYWHDNNILYQPGTRRSARDFSKFAYHTWAGTSFAAPQVTAAAALALSANPNLTVRQLHDLVVGSSTVLGGGVNPNTGYGLLNVQAILHNVNNPPVLPDPEPFPLPPVSSRSANGDTLKDIIAFNTTTRQIDVTLSTGQDFGGGFNGFQLWNSNSGYSPKDWLLLKPADVDGDGDVDIIAFNKINGQIDVSLSDGKSFGGGWKGYQVWNTRSGYSLSSWVLLDPADVTGDGLADIIAFNPSSRQIDVTPSTGRNFGNGYKGYQVWNTNSGYSLNSWTLLSPADVNGDR